MEYSLRTIHKLPLHPCQPHPSFSHAYLRGLEKSLPRRHLDHHLVRCLNLIFERTAEGLDDVVLVISLRSRVLEEHHISKVYFSWPQVSCVSGFPARGSRAVFVSYEDGIGQIQKFALHFFTVFETEKFIDVLKEIFANGSPRLLEYPGLNSEISSQALPFDGPTCRSDGDWLRAASAESSSQLMLPVLESNAVQEQFAPEKIEIREAAETMSSFPPSFMQLLNNGNPAVDEAKPIRHEEDLKTQFMRYLDGNSLQGMILEKLSSSFEMFGHRRYNGIVISLITEDQVFNNNKNSNVEDLVFSYLSILRNGSK